MICFCDSLSLGESHFQLATRILEYLKHEHAIRLKAGFNSTFVESDWKKSAMAVPIQPDGVNCGVFVILFMFRMMKNVASQKFEEFNFNKKFNVSDMEQVRKKMIEIVFQKAELGDLEPFTT